MKKNVFQYNFFFRISELSITTCSQLVITREQIEMKATKQHFFLVFTKRGICAFLSFGSTGKSTAGSRKIFFCEVVVISIVFQFHLQDGLN